MAEKSTTGIGSLTQPTGQAQTAGSAFSSLFSNLWKVDLSQQLAEEALAAAEAEVAAITDDEIEAAAAAFTTAAATPPSLWLMLPSPYSFIEPPEIALPTISGSAGITEGSQETQDMFNALKEGADASAALGEAVFATLDPILQGLEAPADLGVYLAADAAAAAMGIVPEDPETQTRPPIPASDVIPSVARMQLFDEMLYAMRRAEMAAGAEQPDAAGKILCAYTALAIEKFVRRAVIKVSLPDDKVISLTSDLNTFGSNAAAESASGLSNFIWLSAGTDDTGTGAGSAPNGAYSLSSADPMLGFSIVPQLQFYGGIETMKDYGGNFDNSSAVGDAAAPYRDASGEIKLMNLQALLLTMKNGINFV